MGAVCRANEGRSMKVLTCYRRMCVLAFAKISAGGKAGTKEMVDVRTSRYETVVIAISYWE